MTDRRDLDLPAAVTASLLGIALIAVGTPMAGRALGEADGRAFDVTWVETLLGEQTATAREGQTAVAEVEVQDSRVSRVHLAPGPCTDTPGTPLDGPAQISFRLSRLAAGNETVLAEGTFTCADTGAASRTLNGTARPDVGSSEGDSPDEAVAAAWKAAAPGNETSTYRLELSSTRSSQAPLPGLPVGQPTLQAELALHLLRWDAQAAPHGEVVR